MLPGSRTGSTLAIAHPHRTRQPPGRAARRSALLACPPVLLSRAKRHRHEQVRTRTRRRLRRRRSAVSRFQSSRVCGRTRRFACAPAQFLPRPLYGGCRVCVRSALRIHANDPSDRFGALSNQRKRHCRNRRCRLQVVAIRMLVLAYQCVHQRRYDADDDGGHERAAERVDDQSPLEDPVGQPCRDVQHEACSPPVEDAGVITLMGRLSTCMMGDADVDQRQDQAEWRCPPTRRVPPADPCPERSTPQRPRRPGDNQQMKFMGRSLTCDDISVSLQHAESETENIGHGAVTQRTARPARIRRLRERAGGAVGATAPVSSRWP